MSAAVHPPDPVLQAYGFGKLDDASAESVKKHLEICSACRGRVAEMSSDSFLGRLREAHGPLGSSGPAISSLAGLSMVDGGAISPSPPPASSLPPGLAEHPDYEVIGELGQGGMGTVYLALNRLMGRHEVLKVVSSHLMKRRGVLDRFLVEIRNAARLHHTNIVTAYSATRVGQSLVFAMEYVEGLDLAKLVKAKGPLPVTHACHYVHQAAQGLQHAGEHGMVHRDIKPSNLMLAKQGTRAIIKVLDFGLAKVKSEGAVDGGLTHEGQMLGTPDFIAPEQIGDARRADIRADIYSLGCTLYYLLTDSPPFKATSLYEILQAHHSMDALPLNLARPEVPVELAALVARMMAKEPERRFQTPGEVAQAIAPFFKKGGEAMRATKPEVSLAGKPSDSHATVGPGSGPTRPAKKSDRADSATKISAEPTASPAAPWNSLIATSPSALERDDSRPATKARRPRWLWPSVAAAMLALGFLVASAAAGVLMLKTKVVTIVLENVPDNAVVEIDGERITVTPSAGQPIKIEVQAGKKNGVVVKRGDHVLMGESVALDAGKSHTLTVRLVPASPSGSGPGPVESVAISPGTKAIPSESGPGPVESVAISPGTKAILDALEKPVPMEFIDDTPLEDVLKYVKQVTKESIKTGVPIYVDPIGLQEAEKSMTSTVRDIDLKGLPLSTTLPVVLKQLDMAYCVKDDILLITSNESIDMVRKELTTVACDTIPSSKAILELLEIPILMSFNEDTPLEDVVKYIGLAAKKGDAGLAGRIYVDPAGLQEAEKSMTSTVRNLEVEGVPLKTTLRLLLKQLELGFVVKEGFLEINSLESIHGKPNKPANAGGFGGELK